MSWTRNEIVSAAVRIRKAWSGLWPYIALDVQTALVDAEVLSVLLDRDDRIDINVGDIEDLRAALHSEMNVGDYGKTPVLIDPSSLT